MILPEHVVHFDRLGREGAFRSPMLMLGNQDCRVNGYRDGAAFFAQYGVAEYKTLDPDRGDLRLDLNGFLAQLERQYQTVFNLGTIEHVWDAHMAWTNALHAVEVGGTLVSHSPFSGFEDHGIHLTNPKFIKAFVEKNGFEIGIDFQTSSRNGRIWWFLAKKTGHHRTLAGYQPVYQLYFKGKKCSPS